MKTVLPYRKQEIFGTTGAKGTEEYVPSIQPGQSMTKVIQSQKIHLKLT